MGRKFRSSWAEVPVRGGSSGPGGRKFRPDRKFRPSSGQVPKLARFLAVTSRGVLTDFRNLGGSSGWAEVPVPRGGSSGWLHFSGRWTASWQHLGGIWPEVPVLEGGSSGLCAGAPSS